MFGIGRDDLSCFEQTTSKSENGDALVTFDLGGNFDTNDSFILSGNDNAAIEEVGNKERPAEINSRLNREWRVQETGTVGSIQLTYDMSNISGPLGVGTNNLDQLRLMVDNDGDFSTGSTLIEPTSTDAVNNTVTFTVDFTDGQYYTLGSTEQNALPVTLLSFEAKNVDNEKVELNWSTASETSNAFFSIEKSTDGVNFEKIGQLQGANTSSDRIDYQFIDNTPSIGNNFYRLKQTDFSGEFTYSEIQRVYLSFKAQTGRLRVFPNPVESGQDLNLQYELGNSTPIRIRMVSMTGTIVYDKVLDAVEQSNSTLAIPTFNLKAGLYILKVYQEQNQISNHKILIR